MLTIHAVGPREPLLLGTLSMHRRGPEKGRPVLTLDIYCAWCRHDHSITLPDTPTPIEIVHPLVAPCPSGPLAGETIFAMVDPRRANEAREMIRHFRASLRRFLVERRIRHQFAETREVDRRHRLEWDVLPTPPWAAGGGV
jgi:hypothetical protein